MDHEVKMALERLDTRLSTHADQLGRIEQAVRRIEGAHQEVRASVEKARRAIRVALPLLRRMIG